MPLTKITPSLIDLGALSEELKKAPYNFLDESDKEVKEINGISSEHIAKAVTYADAETGETKLLADNELIQKALGIYDTETQTVISHNDILTKTNGGTFVSDLLVNTQSAINANTSDEIASIRSELYQLIKALNSKGILHNYSVENGFINIARGLNETTAYICDVSQIGIVNSGYTNEVYVDNAYSSLINAGMYYIVKKEYSDSQTVLYELVFIKSKQVSTGSSLTTISIDSLNLKDDFGVYDANTVKFSLYNVLGQELYNSFSFSKNERYVETGNMHEIGFSDDTITLNSNCIDKENGFAIAFKVPENKIGTLKTFSIFASHTNNASDLTVYVMKDMDKDNTELSLEQRYEAEDIAIICRSQKFYASSIPDDTMQEITFDFIDLQDYKYKHELDNDRYLFVIVPSNEDATGNWTFKFSRNPDYDDEAQTFNKCYTYKYNTETFLYEFEAKAFNADLLFTTITEDVLKMKEFGYTKGLYSTDIFNINNGLSDFEVDLIINREGYISAASAVDALDTTNGIPVKWDTNEKLADILNTSHIGNNYGLKTNDTVIIGNNICTISQENTDARIFINENVKIDENDKIYRMGYKIAVTLYRDENDTVGISAPLTLVEVRDNPDDSIPNASDKLIFKLDPATINYFYDDYLSTQDKVIFTKAKLSVAWNTSVPQEYFAEGSYYNPNFIGRIYYLIMASANVKSLFINNNQ